MDNPGPTITYEDNTVSTAQPGDVYVDANGKLWRVVWTCAHPTLSMQEIESEVVVPQQSVDSSVSILPRFDPTPILPAKRKLEGAIGALQFEGMRRIFRKGPPTPPLPKRMV